MNSDIQLIIDRLNRIEDLLESKISSKFLTINESAEFLRCSKSKIRILLKSGDLQFVRTGSTLNSTKLIKKRDLLKLIR